MARAREPRVFDGREVSLSSLDKVWFPDDGITKGEVLDYVLAVAPRLLDALRDRPLSMERAVDGITGGVFFHKHVPKHFPAWVRRCVVPSSRGPFEMVVVDDLATLALVTNFGCVTAHVPPATLSGGPDQLVVDLDPSEDDVGALRAAGLAVRALVAELGGVAFARWSGSRGLHVVVPLAAGVGAETAGAAAVRLAAELAARRPELLTTAFHKAERGGRIYLDVGRNHPGSTVAASWTVRARPTAPVAMPVHWDELGDTGPRSFTVRTAPARLGLEPWPGFDQARVDPSDWLT